MSEHWITYVDETGSFERQDSCSLVVGWLTRLDGDNGLEALNNRISAVAPWLPRPLHASFFQRPAWHALSLMLVDGPIPQPWLDQIGLQQQQMESLLRRSRDFWQSGATRDPFADALAAMKDGKEPDLKWIRALDNSLNAASAHDATLRRVWKIADTIESTARQQMVHALSGTFRVRGADAGALVIANAERYEGRNHSDRYLGALQTMVNVAAWSLLAAESKRSGARLEFAVARRGVLHPVLGEKVHLDSPILNQVIRAALNGRKSLSVSGTSLEVPGGTVHDFRDTNQVGLVVADLAANYIFRLLGPNNDRDIRSMEQMLEARVGLSLRLDQTAPYSVASNGWFAHYIQAQLSGELPGVTPLETPVWVVEAAHAWAEHFQLSGWREVLQ